MSQQTSPFSAIEAKLAQAHALLGDEQTRPAQAGMALGIDLGTSDVVSMVVNAAGEPLAVCLDWADVVRDGIVWNFFGAVEILRAQLAKLERQFGQAFTEAATSFPPGTDPRISVNVLEAAGLKVSAVIDEPSAVASLLQLDRAAVVDIGGGTTGIAIVEGGQVIYSGDEATGGHHVSLTLAGNLGQSLDQAEQFKRQHGEQAWGIAKPVFEKMCDIVRQHLSAYQVSELYLSGGTCTLPGVRECFAKEFPDLQVYLPERPIYLTPLAIASYALAQTGATHVH